MAQAYYRKFRPQGWDEVVGQEHVIRTLRNAVGQRNIAHAYLFSGPRGTGKTTTARIIAKAVNCLSEEQTARPCNTCEHCGEINQGRFLDLIEIDAASNTSVDDVRDLRDKINFLPSKGRCKVYIIDEVHMLSNAAFNALLKTLEEPPAHAIFVLATTEVHKIPATVISRCQRHEFRRIPLNIIQAHLKEIAEQEKIHVEAGAVTAIARQATGSMRDAVSLLDQLASTGSSVTLELTQQVLGTAAGQNVLELIEALVQQDMGAGMRVISRALDSGSDSRQFSRQLVDTLRVVLMVKMGNSELVEISLEEADRIKEFASRFKHDALLDAIYQFDRAAQYSSVGWQPGLQLEMAFSRCVCKEPAAEGKRGERLDRKVQKQSENKPSAAGRIRYTTKETAVVKKPLSGSATDESRTSIEQQAAQPPEVAPPNISERAKLKPEKKAVSQPNEDKNTTAHQPAIADIQAIRIHWMEVKASAKSSSPETAALLNSVRNMEMNRNRLVLGFSSRLLRSKMENGANLANARTAIKAVTGLEVEIECRVAGKDEDAPLPDLNINQDSMVGTALSLGGKIIKNAQKLEDTQ